MKIRSGTKIAIGFVALAAILYFGYLQITKAMIMGEKFAPLTPSRVNIVGIAPGAGYRIVVANQIAQLVQTSDEFGASSTDEGGATEGAIKKRLPIKELLQTLQGNQEALGRFIGILNDIKEDESWPTVRVVWRAEDIQKALDGDAAMVARLERDLNMKLDGAPLPTLRPSALENGIIVEAPVPVRIDRGGKTETLVGRVQQPYKPRLMKAVEKQYEDKNVDQTMQAGYYAQEAGKVLSGEVAKENVRQSLEQMISQDTARQRADAPERILKYATVVVTDNHITDASFQKYSGPDGKSLFDLRISLNDEGRKRLWQFSMDRIGTQLLLVAEGVAIAAPKIQHQLSQGDLTITRMRDEVIVREAVDMLNKPKVAGK